MDDCKSYLLQYIDSTIKIFLDSDIPFIAHRRVVTGFNLLLNAIKSDYQEGFEQLLSQLNEIEDLANRIYKDYQPYFDELGRLLGIEVKNLQWGCRIAFFIYDPSLEMSGLQALLTCRHEAIAEQVKRKPVFDEEEGEDMGDLYPKDPLLDLTLQTYYCFKGLTPYLLRNYSMGELHQLTISAGAIAAYQSHKLEEKTNSEKKRIKYVPPSDAIAPIETEEKPFDDPVDQKTKEKLRGLGIPLAD